MTRTLAMIRYLVPLVPLSMTGCDWADASPPRPESIVLEYEVAAPTGAELLSYSWDGGPTVPALSIEPAQRILFGEAGVDENTEVYLSFNEGAGDRVHDSALVERAIAAEATSWTDGRYGAALELTQGSRLDLGPGSAPTQRPATLMFWLRPDPGGGGTPQPLVQAGSFDLRLTRDLRCRMTLHAEPPVTLLSEPLIAGEWNHVAVSFDGPLVDQVRLVVNTSYRSDRVGELASAEEAAAIVFQGFRGALDDLWVGTVSKSSAALLERHDGGAAPGEHELTLSYASENRSLKIWAGTVRDPVLETAEDWSAARFSHVSFEEGRLVRTPAHWERIRTNAPPLARTTHPTVYVGDNRVFVFGGETRDTHAGGVWANTNDTWLLHTRTGRWEEVITEHSPPPSCHQDAAYSPDHRLLLYVGGWRNDIKPWIRYDGTWVFHPDEGRWEEKHPRGAKLGGIANCGLIYHPGQRKFLLFLPGRTRVLTYDPERNRWRQTAKAEVSYDGPAQPEFRLLGSMMTGFDPESGKVVLFGGEGRVDDEVVFFDRTAIFDPDANTIRVLDLEEKPMPRVRSCFAHDPRTGNFVLFGGVQDQRSERNDDLWIFDLEQERWRRLTASNPPSARGGFYKMAYDPDLQRFFVLCGRHSKTRFLDDALSLSVDEDAQGLATIVFDREPFGHHGQWYADLRTPGDARLEFRFSASRDLVTWTGWGDEPGEVVDASARYVKVELRFTRGGAGEEPELFTMGFLPAERERATSDDEIRRIQGPVTPLSARPY